MFFENIIFDKKIDYNDGILNAKDGFLRGNMFKNEFVPYKQYNVAKLVSNSEKGELLMKIYEYDFALNDLSLYLDLHPDDNSVYDLFKMYTEKEREYVKEYERKYGPLELNCSDYSSYMWEKGPWPFSGGKVDV